MAELFIIHPTSMKSVLRQTKHAAERIIGIHSILASMREHQRPVKPKLKEDVTVSLNKKLTKLRHNHQVINHWLTLPLQSLQQRRLQPLILIIQNAITHGNMALRWLEKEF